MSAPSPEEHPSYKRDLEEYLKYSRAFADTYWPECEAVEIRMPIPNRPDPIMFLATRKFSRYLRAYKPEMVAWWHAPDFRSIIWFNRKFEGLSKTQAAVVKLLHEAREKGGHAMHEQTILREVRTEQRRLADVFRAKVGCPEVFEQVIVLDDEIPASYRLSNKQPD